MREGWKAEKAVQIFGNIHLAGQLRSSWLATWGGRSLCHGACLWLAGWTFIVPDNAFLHFSEHLASSGGAQRQSWDVWYHLLRCNLTALRCLWPCSSLVRGDAGNPARCVNYSAGSAH